MSAGFEDGQWLNPPPEWVIEDGVLQAHSGPRTDFWRETHYGFIRDDGHFFGLEVPASFTIQVMIEGAFSELYDQAGLMLRSGAEQWVKAGAEFTDGSLHLSTVVTDVRSDWSVSESLGGASLFGIRMTLQQGALRVQASRDGQCWQLIRLATFEPRGHMLAGPMFCSPERHGLEVRFSGLQLGPPLQQDLHAQV